ncbi:MAG TPA: hypothetical protein VNK95_06250 [Caldilineaceae bacterium]|nr:hypothetical protein [Caldilineaceae bacterium]
MAIWDWLQLLLLLAISGVTALLLALWRTRRNQRCSHHSVVDGSSEYGSEPASRQDDRRQCVTLSGPARLATPDGSIGHVGPARSLSGCTAAASLLPFPQNELGLTVPAKRYTSSTSLEID